eukprot:GHVU01062138.1.p1 GENE.GHVU01062138.1~~GHVU01062138.1.p1  ORF type:complete len:282 (-),score=50.97 GHVU01062138.1:2317-3117(-)
MIKEGATGNDRFEGFIPDLLDLLADKNNWNMTIDLVKDNKYGQRQGAKWSGMVGEIIAKETDLAAAALSITPEREAVIEFSKPFMKTSLTAIMLPETANKVKTLEDLINQTDIEFGIVEDGSTKHQFTSSRDKTYANMWSQMAGKEDSVFVKSIGEGIKKVKESAGSYIFISDNPVLEYEAWHSDCALVTKWKFLERKGYGLAASKTDLTLIKDINEALDEFESNGEMKKLRNRWWNVATCAGCRQQSVTVFAVVLATVAAILSRK